MKKIKKVIYSFLILLLAVLATACGKDSDSPKVMEFVISDDTLEGGAMAEMVERYNNIQDDVEIKLLEYPYNDAKTKVRNMLSARKPPALMRVTGIEDFKNTLADLSEITDIEEYSNVLKNFMLEEEKVAGIPLNLTINGLFYNKTLFDQAGVKVPETEEDIWTWEEFEESLKKVVDNSDARFALSFDRSAHRWRNLLYQFGGGMFNEDGTFSMQDPEFVKTLEYFSHLHDEEIILNDIWLGGEDSGNLFKTGSIAALYSGSWRVLDFSESIDSFEWGVTYMPKAPVRSTMLGTNLLVAFKGSGREEEAKDFIQWLTTGKEFEEYLSLGNYIPPREEVQPIYESGQKEYDMLKEEASAISERFVNDEKYEREYRIGGVLNREVISVIRKEKTAEEAAKAIEEEYSRSKIN